MTPVAETVYPILLDGGLMEHPLQGDDMLKHARRVKLEKDQHLGEALDGVVSDGSPRLLVRDGETIAVIVSPEDYAELGEGPGQDVWSAYDPERARRALRAGAGALVGVDRAALLRDLRDGRSQASAGRPD